jgi:hypothetical protein
MSRVCAVDDDALRDRPTSLRAAAGLVGLEGIALVVLGVLELAHLSGDRKTLGVTTGLFFIALAVALAYAGRALVELHSWARGLVVTVQALGVLTGFSFWGGGTTAYAVLIIAVSLLTLACVLHPATTRALASEDYDAGDSGTD